MRHACEELLEIITWKQLGLYSKPIIILNTCGFFNPLLEMFDRAIGNRFMRPVHRSLWSVAATPEEALQLAETTPPSGHGHIQDGADLIPSPEKKSKEQDVFKPATVGDR